MTSWWSNSKRDSNSLTCVMQNKTEAVILTTTPNCFSAFCRCNSIQRVITGQPVHPRLPHADPYPTRVVPDPATWQNLGHPCFSLVITSHVASFLVMSVSRVYAKLLALSNQARRQNRTENQSQGSCVLSFTGCAIFLESWCNLCVVPTMV